MARSCTICSHAKLVNMDRQLLRGDMLNSIAQRLDRRAVARSSHSHCSPQAPMLLAYSIRERPSQITSNLRSPLFASTPALTSRAALWPW